MIEGICLACLAWAIAQVETGDKPRAVGAHGELTRFQFRKATWEEWSDVPFRRAPRDEVEADRVFEKHARWIVGALEGLGLEVSVASVAIMWNAGYGNVMHGRVPDSSLDYALRVENLYALRERECAKVRIGKENNERER
jgi:hypothetical protein